MAIPAPNILGTTRIPAASGGGGLGSVLSNLGGAGGVGGLLGSIGDAFSAQNDRSKYAERRRYEGLADAADILNQYEFDNAVALNEAQRRFQSSRVAAQNANFAAQAAAQRATEQNRLEALRSSLRTQRRSAKKAKKELRPFANSGKNSLAISEGIFSLAPQIAQSASNAVTQGPINLFGLEL